MQPKEFDEIEGILPTLQKEGLLTEMDCHIIAASKNLVKRKAAVYSIIISKTKNEAAILNEAFRKMTEAIQGKENSKSNNAENNHSILPSTNPFLHNAIINNLIGFLPLDGVKQSRLICKEWISTAEMYLRKRSAITFRPNGLIPSIFSGVSKYSNPNLPFHAFAFSTNTNLKYATWKISEIEDFFEKWGKNIKEMTFNYIALTRKCNLKKKEVFLPCYNVTTLFIDPFIITSLVLRRLGIHKKTSTFEISLEKFVSIKTIYLNDIKIIVPVENQSARIAPLNVDFRNVSLIQNGRFASNFYYNDLFDFSKASNINLVHISISILYVIFIDMGRDVFNANQLHLERVPLQNWAQAKGDVQLLSLEEVPFEEKNNLRIRQLKFSDSKINLTVLPETLEFLDLSNCNIDIICTEPFDLPNLKYLNINVKYSNILAYFSNCTNLEELEILNFNSTPEPCTFSVGCLPKSLKRLRVELSQIIKLTDNCVFELDSLILECTYVHSRVIDCIAITEQIKAKLLVVKLNSAMEIDTNDIVVLVQINNQSQKILIASDSDLHQKTPFEGSQLSKCVNKESNVYQFESGIGKIITKEEFQRFFKRDEYFLRHFNFKAILEMQMVMLANGNARGR